MKKRVLSMLLTAVMLLTMGVIAPYSALADDVVTASSGWKYSVTTIDGKSSAMIKGYTKDMSTLNIPSKIDGYTVTKIGDYVFSEETSVLSITIPDTVTEIGAAAFRGCCNAKTINLGKSIKKLGMYAFAGTAISKIVFPDSITTMDEAILSGCTSLKSITLSSNITEIPTYFCNSTAIEDIIIPEGVETIKGTAFFECRSLKTVYAPSTLKYIYDSSFDGDTSLKNIYLPEGFKSFGQQAFRNCKSLEVITFPSTVTSVGTEAFSGCTSLKAVIAKCNDSFMYGNAVGFDTSYNLIPGVVIYCTAGSKIYDYAVDNGITTRALSSAPADPSANLKVPSIDNAVVSGIKAKT